MNDETMAVLRTMQINEATDHRIYARLAARADSPNREVLARMAADEARHCKVWEGYTGRPARPVVWKVWWYTLLAWVFGLTFVVNLLEDGEELAQDHYRKLVEELPETRGILEDETRHEAELADMIDEERLKYIGSMVLGLNDALVGLTGALAGFTLALGSNATVGLAGFITGVAATLSMAASEYLSKKSDPHEKHPIKAAVYTGIAYLITVTLLLLPYVLTSSPYLALGICLFTAACIIFVFTFFVSVVRREAFRPQFLEMLCISFGVAAVSFLIGWAARTWLGIDM